MPVSGRRYGDLLTSGDASSAYRLHDHDLAVLRSVDDVWRTFDEVAGDASNDRVRLSRSELLSRLRSLRHRGYVDSRRGAHGRVEYAITGLGDIALSRDAS